MLVVAMIIVIIFIAFNIIRVWHAFGSATTLNEAFPYIRNVITVFVAGVLIFIVLLVIYYRMVLTNISFRSESESQLRAAKMAAEDANHSKTQFLSTMSNELRTPLNHVLNSASLLQQTQLDDQQKKMVSVVHRGAVSLLSVINDSLDFFKIESGKLTLENNPLSLKDCIEEVRTLLLADSQHIAINYQIAPQVPALIVSDIVRLRQVLINLLGNAVQFTDTGILQLDVELLSEQANNLQLQFKIADAGDKENTTYTPPSLDEVMYTTHYTGLGLSIAARLVALMGGAVKIESTSGGSVFTFTIRAGKIMDTQVRTVTDTNGDKVDKELSRRIPLRILSADDNEMSQLILSSILRKMGYKCEAAKNGTEAVAKAVEEKYDLIFMDMFMPEMDGMEATKRIREFYLQSTRPVIIALTANALDDASKFKQAGINSFIVKPIKPKDIEQAIIEHCSNMPQVAE
ncbi:response regulator [Ilyomonas limi]|uniref:histidine kinase n=1 Tax=Ilyomonas limi TaxID=2575867 RepID=A0A4U3L075_9BACT|nr:response regulator [Ilyomonas limi]TKK68328.1 response regulator [Ilyomonas limi]